MMTLHHLSAPDSAELAARNAGAARR